MRKLDRTDIGILNNLQTPASPTELARSVNLRPRPVSAGCGPMETWRDSAAGDVVVARSAGLDVNVFIHVSLEKQVEQSLRFEEEIAERR